MLSYLDAKVQAQILREALRGKGLELKHAECLELIAKIYGLDNWNILAAKICPAKR